MYNERKIKNFAAPYLGGKVSKHIIEVNGKSGVYIVRKKGNKKFSYIGFSASNLYKTILRHFQSWNDPTQRRVTYPKNGYEVKVLKASINRAAAWEKFLIIKFKPKDNETKLEMYTTAEKTQFTKGLTDFEKEFGKVGEEAPF